MTLEKEIYSKLTGGLYSRILEEELLTEFQEFTNIEAIRKRLLWRCHKNHVEESSLKFRVIRGCRECGLIKKNGSALEVNPALSGFVSGEKLLKLKNTHSKSREKILFYCPDCGVEDEASINLLVLRGCSNCQQFKVKLVIDYSILSKYWSYKNNVDCEKLLLEDKYLFTCEMYGDSHTFESTLNRFMVNNYSCDYCSSKKILAGFNDFMSLDARLENEYNWEENGDINPYELGIGSNVKLFWNCSNCRNLIEAGVNERRAVVGGCKYCSNRSILDSYNSNSNRFPELLKLWSGGNSGEFDGAISGGVYLWRCEEFGHDFHNTLSNMVRGRISCRICSNREILLGFNDIGTLRPEILDEVHSGSRDSANVMSRESIVEWRCHEFGHIYKMNISKRLSGRDCPKCGYFGVSKIEKELSLVLDEVDVEYRNNFRGLIGGRELDFYFPSLGKAIEVNGDYWHSDEVLRRSKFNGGAIDYHSMKYNKAIGDGVELIFIWEHDWMEHNELVVIELFKFLNGGDYNKFLFERLESVLDGGYCSFCEVL